MLTHVLLLCLASLLLLICKRRKFWSSLPLLSCPIFSSPLYLAFFPAYIRPTIRHELILHFFLHIYGPLFAMSWPKICSHVA